MKPTYALFALLLTAMLACGCSGLTGASPQRAVLYQVSTFNALLDGVYDGETAVSELMRHGDFGIGTFNALDGEMLAVNGNFYQVRADGRVYPVAPETKTPFAAVTFFRPDRVVEISGELDFDGLKRRLESLIENKNIFYAFRIEGSFARMYTRSVPIQKKPYPQLAKVVETQPEFNLSDTTGTIVAFRCPEYVKGINIPGLHAHFIEAGGKGGGHVRDLVTQKVRVEIMAIADYYLRLPGSGDFARTDLQKDRSAEADKVEK